MMPSEKILEKYADIFVKCGLNNGNGINKGDTVLVNINDAAREFLPALYKSILKAGGHPLLSYTSTIIDRIIYDYSSEEQLTFTSLKYRKEQYKAASHRLAIIAEDDKYALKGVDPKLIRLRRSSRKELTNFVRELERNGRQTWSLGLFPTTAMANDIGMTLEEYWQRVIEACYLNEKYPYKKWKQIITDINTYKEKLDELDLTEIHISGENIDLKLDIGEQRKWLGGSGHNIPSFEIFASPDWRHTNGNIKFNQPLYRNGNKITGIYLEFKNGEIANASAEENNELLQEMIKVENMNRIGEFSMTDKRFSPIKTVMGNTLFDENIGGENGNSHIALGNAYTDGFNGDQSNLTKEMLVDLGFNQSPDHVDIINTEKKKITAYSKKLGKNIDLYEDGIFLI